MPSINMIAPRRAEKKRLERDMRRLLLVICAELAIGTALGGLMWFKTMNTNARIADLETQLIKLGPKIRNIDELNAKTRSLQPKLALLNDAKDRTLHWYSLLDKLSTSLPEKTWIRRIDSADPTPEATESKITFNGISESQKNVGELMLRLYKNQDLDKVGLKFTQSQEMAKRQVYEFEVAADLKTAKSQEKGVTPSGTQKS